MTCVAFSGLRRHNGANHDGDKAASENQEKANIGQCWEGAVGVHNNECRDPSVEKVDDKDVPAFVCVVWMEQAIHADDLVGQDRGHGGGTKEPTKEVPPVCSVSINIELLGGSTT